MLKPAVHSTAYISLFPLRKIHNGEIHGASERNSEASGGTESERPHTQSEGERDKK